MTKKKCVIIGIKWINIIILYIKLYHISKNNVDIQVIKIIIIFLHTHARAHTRTHIHIKIIF